MSDTVECMYVSLRTGAEAHTKYICNFQGYKNITSANRLCLKFAFMIKIHCHGHNICSLLNNITSNTCSINWNPKDLIDISFFVSFHCVSQLSAIEWQTHIQTTQKAQLFYKSTRSAHLFIVGLFHSKFCKGVLLVQVQFSTKILDCLVCLV